jgi:hypothetical protein
LIVNTHITEDDEDKVEELDLELNTDADAFPNYIDWDDDNDGVLTKDEDPLNNENDTDGDGILNYLDNDDDGDGVLTIDESVSNDDDSDGVVNYLDSDTTLINSRVLAPNQYQEIFTNDFSIEFLKLTNSDGNTFQFDLYDFGSVTKKNTKIDDTSI